MENLDPVAALFARAEVAGFTMQAICEEAGVAQSTPSRWKKDSDSATLGTIRQLNDALTRLIEQKREAA